MKIINLKLTEKELHCLYDVCYLTNVGDLKINNLLKDWETLFEKIEKLAVPEIYNENN